MVGASETGRELRFACTQCGACCNRSPETLLSEAAALADVFVFRLMFRLYALPRTLADRLASERPPAGSAEAFYESRRLLAAFAARKYPAKRRYGAKAGGHMNYLAISALTLDTGSGKCSALSGGRCGIYDRRPLACRTVPFHYSRPEASADRELEAFVRRPGHGCDTSAEAPIVVEQGHIVDPESRQARNDALTLADHDRPWQDAILRRLKTRFNNGSLPSLREIEANARFGATTTSMRAAWEIAAEAGLIGREAYKRLLVAQVSVIERELAAARCTPDARETLVEMRAEYQRRLND